MPARRLQPVDLLSLERYHLEREDFRRRVMAHKAVRRVFLGPHVSLTFEDTLTQIGLGYGFLFLLAWRPVRDPKTCASPGTFSRSWRSRAAC